MRPHQNLQTASDQASPPHAAPGSQEMGCRCPGCSTVLTCLSFPFQAPVGMHPRGPRLGAPEDKPARGGLAHLSSMGSHPLGQMSSPGQDSTAYPPPQFQPGFLPARHGGALAGPPDFPESSDVLPGHMYRPYKYLNRAPPAVWNGSHGAASPGSSGLAEKPPTHPPRSLGHVMDSRVMRPPLPPSQWTEQPRFLSPGVPSAGYLRAPCRSGGHRLPPPLAPASLFGAPSQGLRGTPGGDSMMDSPEMIAMQRLSSRGGAPSLRYQPGAFPHTVRSAPMRAPALGTPTRTRGTREAQAPDDERGESSLSHLLSPGSRLPA